MRIYIDVTVLMLATFVTGIQRVTREITVRLIKDESNEIVLLHYNAKENAYHKIDNQKFCAFFENNVGVKSKMITRQKVDLSEIKEGSVFFDLDAAWMCRVKRSYLLPILKQQGARVIAHIYDIISITHPQYCLERGVYNFMDYIGAHLQYADEIIVNAQATVCELEKLTSQLNCPLPKCTVIPLGADFSRKGVVEDEQVSDALVEIVKSKPFVLMVGTIEPRKNHKLLLEAYDKGLKEMGFNIIMAGYMGWNMEWFKECLENHPDYGKGIHHLEGLDDQSITYLYQHAKFLVFCSYTEGFGLPIVEAVMRGTPVVAADVPVLREVGGEFCVWFEQDNAVELCELLERYVTDGKIYNNIKENMRKYQPYTWAECYETVGKVLNKNE